MPSAAVNGVQTRPRFIDVSRPELGDAEIEAIVECVRSGWLVSGPRAGALEDRLAGYLGVDHVRCLSSCTAGLSLALRLADIRPGDEVLLPAITFVSCANAVEHAGAHPVLVDIDLATGLIDLEALDARIGPRTRAIMPVHLAGRPVDMERVNAIRDRHGVAVIEDAAHAIGAAWSGRRIGAHGNFCSFSFHATKNMTTFEGGALVVKSEEQADRVRRLSLHGLTRSAWSRHGAEAADVYDVPEPGFKLALNDVAAAVGLMQLSRLDTFIERRAKLAALYDELLDDLPVQRMAPLGPAHRHAHHLYLVTMQPGETPPRGVVAGRLREAGIGTTVHFRPLHEYRYYRDRYGVSPQSLPAATAWGERALTLPLHPGLEEDEVAYVAEALQDALR